MPAIKQPLTGDASPISAQCRTLATWCGAFRWMTHGPRRGKGGGGGGVVAVIQSCLIDVMQLQADLAKA